MMKAATLLLVAAQALGSAQVIVCAPEEAREARACAHVAPAPGGPAIDARDACHECGMSDCRDMSACVAGASALATTTGVEWTTAPLLASEGITVRHLHSYTRPPIRPPPRA